MRRCLNEILKKYGALSQKVRASIWFAVCVFFQRGVTTLATPIFTRLLSEAEYGNFSVFNSWLDIVTIFVSLKLSAGVFLQGLIKFSDEREQYASSFQGLTLTLTLIWTCVYLLFRGFWNELFSLTTVQMLSMFVMIWATAAFSLWSVAQRSVYQYKALIAVTIVSSLAKPGVGVLFVMRAHDRVTARILSLALVELVCYSGLFFVQMRRGKKFYSARFWKYALMFNIPLLPHYLSSAILGSSDRIMIKRMVGAREAGMYSVSYQISQIMMLLANALEQSINPWIYEKIKARRVDDTRQVVYIALTLMAVMTMFAMLFAPEVLALFAPPEYQEAVWVIPPVMISVFFIFSYLLFSTYEFYFEKTRHIALATAIGAALNIALNGACIRRFGYIAAGYTTLLCYALFAAFHFIFMGRICAEQLKRRQPYDTRIILGVCGSMLLFGALALAVYRNPYLRYGLLAAMAAGALLMRKRLSALARNILGARKR